MIALTRPHITAQEYLELERQAESKSEYYAGEVFAMSGASERHNSIAANTVSSLVAQLKGRPCKAYGSDMRVKVERTGLYTYPDVVVVCGQPQLEDSHLDTLLNPSVLCEVLSPSTEAYDRGAKFAHYRQIDSLTDYVLVAQDQVLVEHYQRQADGRWVLADYRNLEATLRLDSIDCALPLAEIYDKVTFPTEAPSYSRLRIVKEGGVEWHAEPALTHPAHPVWHPQELRR